MNLQIKPQSSKFVLLVLADFATERNKSAVSNEGFQFATGMTLAQIEYALQNLVDNRVIEDSGQRVGEQKEIRVFQLMMLKPLEKIKRRAKQVGLPFTEAEEIYKMHPRPVARPRSLNLISKAIAAHGFEFIKEKTALFAKAWQGRTDIEHCAHSSTWFQQERYLDDIKTIGGSFAARATAGPKFNEVREYVLQHVTRDDRGWSSSFYGYWNDPKRNWKDKTGQSIDWKERLSKQLAAWRASEQKTNLTPA
jgi:hypothetical protein